jgi:hypothetical protein
LVTLRDRTSETGRRREGVFTRESEPVIPPNVPRVKESVLS